MSNELHGIIILVSLYLKKISAVTVLTKSSGRVRKALGSVLFLCVIDMGKDEGDDIIHRC